MNKDSEEMPKMNDVILFEGSDLEAPQNSSHLCQGPHATVVSIGLPWFYL